ncbi:MAG: hypothetical protein ACRDYU_07105 [Actinomycetes bacterium]
MDALVLLCGVGLVAGVLALVVLSSAVLPDALACATVRVPGGRERAFRARYATGAVRGISVLPLVGAVTAGAGLAAGLGGLPTGFRIAGGVLVAGGLAVLAYRSRGGATQHFFVALTPSGVLFRPNHLRAFVPWEAVADVALMGRAAETAELGLLLRDQDAVGAGTLDRLHLRLHRPKKVHLAVRLDDLDTEPRAFVHAVCYYLDNPGRRNAIGTAEELRHLRALQHRELHRPA